ncbi:MAG TPA: hypothetical protein LFV90_02415 [Rickettsia endosymbiont of Columbicola hoogstraali]|nr:hypothetical protein [Rickettsia endosymbiont of Columbicola hoogstraali]
MKELIEFLKKKGLIGYANSLKEETVTINLSSRGIGDDGAKALAEAIKNNNSITQLIFNNNQIEVAEAEAIGE